MGRLARCRAAGEVKSVCLSVWIEEAERESVPEECLLECASAVMVCGIALCGSAVVIAGDFLCALFTDCGEAVPCTLICDL